MRSLCGISIESKPPTLSQNGYGPLLCARNVKRLLAISGYHNVPEISNVGYEKKKQMLNLTHLYAERRQTLQGSFSAGWLAGKPAGWLAGRPDESSKTDGTGSSLPDLDKKNVTIRSLD